MRREAGVDFKVVVKNNLSAISFTFCELFLGKALV
jgi:hypothetical protein